MEHHTTYLGQLRIDPPLSAPELDWLLSFAEWGGGPTGDPFDVPMNPRAELADSDRWAGGGSSPPRSGIPAGVRDWVPCDEGCHLTWRPAPRSNDALLALRFLVDHYLGPRALARDRGPAFEAFTFDHRVDGVLAAHRDDTEELFLLRAEDGRFHRETLDPGVSRWEGSGGEAEHDALMEDRDGDDEGDENAGRTGRSGLGSPGEGSVHDLVAPRRRRTGSARRRGRTDD